MAQLASAVAGLGGGTAASLIVPASLRSKLFGAATRLTGVEVSHRPAGFSAGRHQFPDFGRVDVERRAAAPGVGGDTFGNVSPPAPFSRGEFSQAASSFSKRGIQSSKATT